MRDDLREVLAVHRLVDQLRREGAAYADLDPLTPNDALPEQLTVAALADAVRAEQAQWLGLEPVEPGELVVEFVRRLQECYLGRMGFEFMHLEETDERAWWIDQVERGRCLEPFDADAWQTVLARLISVEELETHLRRTYLGAKTFSLAGLDAMVPMLDELAFLAAGSHPELMLAMAHRGRLNVLAHTVGVDYGQIVAEFEAEQRVEVATLAPAHMPGDVKYHYGASVVREVAGQQLRVTLAANPSHLEFVNPVLQGRARAILDQHGADAALACMIHGDASVTGQGVVAETLNLARLSAYGVGGVIHLIANNQVGFTTDPVDGRSTRFASDSFRGYGIPVVHVNADDLQACRTAIRLAYRYRATFRKDVCIDLIGYRRLGHNEGDEPAFTQPVETALIGQRPTIAALVAEQAMAAGAVDATHVDVLRTHASETLRAAHQRVRTDADTDAPVGIAEHSSEQVPEPDLADRAVVGQLPAPGGRDGLPYTQLSRSTLRRLGSALFTINDESAHPKVATLYAKRREAVTQGSGLDWGGCELLAYASLIDNGVAVRLTGQDVGRGTFSHRHAVIHRPDGTSFCPLVDFARARGIDCTVANSPLTETACLGFEYGYAVQRPDDLVVWEAQFGDFANGAQVVIDQFITSGHAKWGEQGRLVLLLPHGLEGSGPEHSSARLERFLQLAAGGNIRVCQPSTGASLFHLLRSQGLALEPTPLVILTPKSMLRADQVKADELAIIRDGFQPIIAPAAATDTPRLLLATGKLTHELEQATPYPLIRLEQLYPFPDTELRAALAAYPHLQEVVWVQEEPENQGAWRQLRHRIEASLPDGVQLTYLGRNWSSTPSEGYPPDHRAAQAELVARAGD